MKSQSTILKGKSFFIIVSVVAVLIVLTIIYSFYNKKNVVKEVVLTPTEQAKFDVLNKSKLSFVETSSPELIKDKALPKDVSMFLDLKEANSLSQVQQSKDVNGKAIYKISLVAPKDLTSFHAQVLSLLKDSKLWGEVTEQVTESFTLIETGSIKYRARISSTATSATLTNVFIEVQSK